LIQSKMEKRHEQRSVDQTKPNQPPAETALEKTKDHRPDTTGLDRLLLSSYAPQRWQQVSTGCNPEKTRRKPPTKRFFYAQNLSTSYYVGLGRHSKEWSGRVSDIATCSVRRHACNLGVRFKSSDTRDHPMKNSNAQTEQPTTPIIDFNQAFAELLLKRVKQGGASGQFLAEAFVSAYRPNRPFFHGLFAVAELDAEALTLFKKIIAMRSGAKLPLALCYEIEAQIFALGNFEKGGVQ